MTGRSKIDEQEEMREIVETEGETMERGAAHVPPGEGRTLRVMGDW
jgi:hypothetical protein